MTEARIIKGNSNEEIWQQVSNDLVGKEVFEYDVLLDNGTTKVQIDVDIDLGGGFEGGFELTTLKALLDQPDDFRFAIHKEHFLDEVGKFFGMQDVVIGDADFDKHVVVKTNDETRVKSVFSDPAIRTFFQGLDEDFTFGITSHDHQRVLEFTFEKGVVDPTALRNMYDNFCTVLRLLNNREQVVPSPL